MNLLAVRDRIAACAKQYGRDPDAITLLAVTKKQSIDTVRAAYAAGQRIFGENYLQEALPKIEALTGMGCEWHFIGPIQSNKTRKIAENFDWVQSVASSSIAKRLHEQRPAHLPPLNICIEVNLNAEASKSGVTPENLMALAQTCQSLSRLRLRGLMAIPAPSDDMVAARANFHHLYELQQQLKSMNMAVDTLSMGMSHDLEAAIAEGSTLVRIGQAIFGPRTNANHTSSSKK